MVRQALDLFGQAIGRKHFNGLDDASMEHPPPLLEKTPIGHLVGQGVLEGIFALGEQARLIEKLRSLEVREAAMQRFLWQLGNSLYQGEENLCTNDGDGLKQALLLGRQAVDTGGQHSLHRGRDLNGREGLHQTVRTALASQRLEFYQGANT